MGGSPMKRIRTTFLICGLLFAVLAPVGAEPPRLPVPAFDQSAVAARGYFYVGGTYVGEPGKEIMHGQTYVEVVAPKDVRRPYPLVLIHGAWQTATNWMGTPDGRKGWADYFVEQGYIVYMIDQPMRGRSAWHPGDGPTRMATAQQEEFQFTASAVAGTWPQAKKHTQWPGEGENKGREGDRGRARGRGRWARPIRLLDAEGAGAPAREPQEHPGDDHGRRGLLSPGVRPLHREVSEPGRRERRVHPAPGQGNSGQRPHGDDRKEQSRDRASRGRMGPEEREVT